jgi:hypothetical protein
MENDDESFFAASFGRVLFDVEPDCGHHRQGPPIEDSAVLSAETANEKKFSFSRNPIKRHSQ